MRTIRPRTSAIIVARPESMSSKRELSRQCRSVGKGLLLAHAASASAAPAGVDMLPILALAGDMDAEADDSAGDFA